MGAMLLGMGTMHFVAPKPFDTIIPAELPGSPRFYTYASGVGELATGALEAYMTVLSNRLNSTMQTLTVFTIALAFLGAIFGAWGMNVELPLANHKYAFWIIVSVVAGVVLTGVAWARRKRWL